MVAPTVVLDLDGTLVDSAPDLVATLNIIFARTGLPPVAYDAARNMVGGGARALIVRGLKAEGRTLDYKRTLPGSTDEEKREFLADVSSFANAAGGDIVYGIDGASVFTHPKCINTYRNGQFVGEEAPATGY